MQEALAQYHTEKLKLSFLLFDEIEKAHTDAPGWVKAAAWYPHSELSRGFATLNRMRRVCQSPSWLLLFG